MAERKKKIESTMNFLRKNIEQLKKVKLKRKNIKNIAGHDIIK